MRLADSSEIKKEESRFGKYRSARSHTGSWGSASKTVTIRNEASVATHVARMKSLLEEVRGWLIDEKLDLISDEDLVQRADEAIARLDEPPSYLINLSLGESLMHVPRLDLIKEPVSDSDCPRLARTLLERYRAGTIGLEDIGAYALKIVGMLGVRNDAYDTFNWIDDEVSLLSAGIKERASSERAILEVLESLNAGARPDG
jgi:hypothetical protein